MDIELDIGPDIEHAQAADHDDGDIKLLTTCVRGVRGKRIVKALTKIEGKKKKRIARQEQVRSVIFLIEKMV